MSQNDIFVWKRFKILLCDTRLWKYWLKKTRQQPKSEQYCSKSRWIPTRPSKSPLGAWYLSGLLEQKIPTQKTNFGKNPTPLVGVLGPHYPRLPLVGVSLFRTNSWRLKFVQAFQLAYWIFRVFSWLFGFFQVFSWIFQVFQLAFGLFKFLMRICIILNWFWIRQSLF